VILAILFLLCPNKNERQSKAIPSLKSQ